MSKPVLLIANMSAASDWAHGVVNRNRHILDQLVAAGAFSEVIALDAVPFTWRKRLKVLAANGLLLPKPGQHAWVCGALARTTGGAHLITVVTAVTKWSARRLVQRLVPAQTPVVVWSYNPLLPELFDWFPRAFKVFDAVDNWLDHPAYRQQQDRLRAAYQQIADATDQIFTVSEPLRTTLFSTHQHTAWIPNGVDVAHFSAGECREPRRESASLILSYHGVMQSRVNFDLIRELATRRPDWEFRLAGPVWREVQATVNALTPLPNVRLVGAVPYDQLPHFLACVDVSIIPHHAKGLSESMDPLKLSEALAAGKPVVSAPVTGAERFGPLVRIAQTPNEWIAAITAAVAEDSPAARTQRQEAMQHQTWADRANQMLTILSQHPKWPHTP
jgi:UDP-galactopyranose mutase